MNINVDRYQKLIRFMKNYQYSEKEIEEVYVISLGFLFLKVNNFEQFLEHLSEKASSKGAFGDTLTEGKAALIFAYNGFEVTYLGHQRHQKGPDLLAKGFGYQFYVEVRRFIKDRATEEQLEKAIKREDRLFEYGSYRFRLKVKKKDAKRGILAEGWDYVSGSSKDVSNLYDVILEESAQLPEGEIGIVFIWSDNMKMEETEFELSMHEFDKMMRDNPTPAYEKLSGVLFYDGWLNVGTGQRFYLHLNPQAQNPVLPDLAERLKNLQKPRGIF